MTVTHNKPSGDPAPNEIDRRKLEFARALERKLGQGYEIEAQNATQALVVAKGRPRLFGLLRSGNGSRYIASMDEEGNVTTQRVDALKERARRDSA
jgi:hypothetical protein